MLEQGERSPLAPAHRARAHEIHPHHGPVLPLRCTTPQRTRGVAPAAVGVASGIAAAASPATGAARTDTAHPPSLSKSRLSSFNATRRSSASSRPAADEAAVAPPEGGAAEATGGSHAREARMAAAPEWNARRRSTVRGSLSQRGRSGDGKAASSPRPALLRRGAVVPAVLVGGRWLRSPGRLRQRRGACSSGLLRGRVSAARGHTCTAREGRSSASPPRHAARSKRIRLSTQPCTERAPARAMAEARQER